MSRAGSLTHIYRDDDLRRDDRSKSPDTLSVYRPSYRPIPPHTDANAEAAACFACRERAYRVDDPLCRIQVPYSKCTTRTPEATSVRYPSATEARMIQIHQAIHDTQECSSQRTLKMWWLLPAGRGESVYGACLDLLLAINVSKPIMAEHA